MRVVAPPLLLALLPACAGVPGLAEPEGRAEARALVYELQGRTGMQSDSGPGIVDNPPLQLDQPGIDDRDTGFGARISVGDGFSGLELDLTAIEDQGGGGPLSADWGALRAGDTVESSLEMYDVRLRWIAGRRWRDAADEWGLGLGFGGAIAHRRLRMRVREVSGLRSQDLDMADRGMVYLAARGRFSWTSLALTADYAVSQNMNFGGDFRDTQQEVGITLTYRLDDRRMELFAGYQVSAFPGRGTEDGFDYAADFTLDGYFAGLSLVF